MNKNVLLGITALGGLILIATLLPETPNDEAAVIDTQGAKAVALPSAVTSSFPTYPNTDISQSRESTGDDGRISYSFSLTTQDTIGEINQWYRDALSQNGWSIKSDKNVAGYQIIQAEKDNLYTSMQAANSTNGAVSISQQAQVRP